MTAPTRPRHAAGPHPPPTSPDAPGVPKTPGAGGTGRAHAKAIVIGEHAVVYGAPALALPVPQLPVHVSVQRSTRGPGQPGHQVFFTTPTPTPTPAPAPAPTTATAAGGLAAGAGEGAAGAARPAAAFEAQGLNVLIARFAEVHHLRPPAPLDVWVHGAVPHGRGLGSSAACARALALALADLHGITLDEGAVFDLVQHAENVAHGRSSGVDAATVGARGPLWFTAGTTAPAVLACPGTFVIADSGTVGRTKDAVNGLRARLSATPGAKDRFVTRARHLAEATGAALAAGDAARAGAHLNDYHGLLAAAELSTPAIDHLVRAARTAGSLGAKITGGGLGGCVIAWTHPEQAADVTRHLTRAGAVQTWAVPLRGLDNHAQ